MLLSLSLCLMLVSMGMSCPSQCVCEKGSLTCRVPRARSLPQFLHTANTTVLDLSANNILNIPKHSLKSFPNLEELILDGNKIYFIENGAFQGCSKLKKISIKNNNLHFLGEDVFVDVPNLEELYLSNNKLIKFPHLGENKLLKKLCVSYNNIEAIPSKALYENRHISELKLKLNRLTSLPRDIFPSDVTSYTMLNLVGNRLRNIPEVVEEMTQLESLSLCFNPIKMFKPGDFSTLTKLKTFSSTGVGLTEIYQNVFNSADLEELYFGKNSISGDYLPSLSIANLKKLVLKNNKLQRLSVSAFSGISRLETLDLSHSNISEIEAVTFAPLSALKALDLQGNHLLSVPMLNFNINLEKLYLDGNNIREVEEDDFRNLDLVELSLSGNSMTSFQSLLLGKPPRMTSLDLSHNSLDRIPDVVKTSLQNLKTLNISNNVIEEIKQDDFLNFPKLQTLSMKGNNLTVLPDDVFMHLPNLKKLHLCRNSLNELNPLALHTLPFLEVFTADKNSIEEIQDSTFLSNSNLKHISLNNNQLIQIEKRAFEKVTKLEELWLLFNNLTKPPHIGLSAELRVIGLCNNPIGNLEDGALDGPKGLEVVLLRNIGLTRLSKTTFGNTDQIRNLNLASGNNLTYVPEVIKSMPLLRVLKLSGNPIERVSVNDFANLNNLREVRLNEMDLQSFDITRLFPALPALRSLYLASNPWHCDCKMQWYSLGVDGARAHIETIDREEIVCSSPPRYKGKRIDFLRLGDFRQCAASSVKHIDRTSAILSLPFIAMLAQDHHDVYTKVSYQPLGGGMEKVLRVNKNHRGDFKIKGLTPSTYYVICIETITSSGEDARRDIASSKLHAEEKGTCHKIKTSGNNVSGDGQGKSNGSLSKDLTIIYIVLGIALGVAAVAGFIATIVWCRKSEKERHNRFADISGIADDVINNHQRVGRNGNRAEGPTPKKRSGMKDSLENYDINGAVAKSNGGHVNEACDVIGEKARTKL